MLFRLLRKLLISCMLLLFWAAAQAAPTPAGTVISNTASATFVDATTGLSVRINSNTVNTTVSALEALTLNASQNLLIGVGASFTINHNLANTGNTATNYLITASVAGGSGFTPLNLQVVLDVNGNGLVDAGEPVVPAGGVVPVAVGATAGLLITGQIPAGAVPGQTAQLTLRAVSQLQSATAVNTDTINLTNGAAVQVSYAASSASATQGVALDFTARATNNGNMAASPANVTVNGAPATLFILRAPVPVNTTFTSAQAATNAGAQTLYHLTGAAANSYVTTVPAGGVVDAVAWSLPGLAQGALFQGRFSVMVNSNAAGNVSGAAYADWTDAGAPLTTTSNTVVLALPARAAGIFFYTNNSYTNRATQSTPGNPLYVQTDAAICNADPATIGTVPVTIVSQLTGDSETYTAVETGPNTGIFRILPSVPTANAATHIVASGDGILEVLRNDTVTATITACGGISVSATTTLLVDPSGTVYNSTTNQPIAGATVQLIDITGAGNGGSPGGPAVVFQMDGVTPAPSVVVTGADGFYEFPLVLNSTYRLVVTAPAGFSFPSQSPAALQPAGRLIDTPGSYGGNFLVAGVAVHFDLPMDPGGGTGGLFIQKTANKKTAEVGDFVDYSVKINNVATVPLPAVVVSDNLPAGFAYVRGTARLNGAALADPAGGAGPTLQFAVGALAAGAQPVLTYRVRIGAGSQSGNGVNTAQAASGAVRSNSSSVRVQVVGGVFSNKAYVIGKVFADCSRDGVQDAGEPGIPGVRIYLEDGTYAVTDEEGKYSFYGLEPRTHVAKLDNITLPAGATLAVLGNRNAFDAGSRFVDLINGELHKADFAIAECTPGIRDQIAARRKALGNPSEITQAAGLLLQSNRGAIATDSRTLPASGAMGLPGAQQNNAAGNTVAPLSGVTSAIGSVGSIGTLGAVGDTGGPAASSVRVPQPIFTPANVAAVQPAAPAGAEAAAAEQALQPLEDLLPELNGDTGFVGLVDDQLLPVAQTRVRVKGPLGARFELTVNGQPVAATQVGKKSSLEKNKVLAWEYIGVDLKPGRNTLSVRALDSFGNARGTAQITVRVPGVLAKIDIGAPAQLIADGATAVPVIISLRDAQGLPVAARTQVSLQASLGQWQTPDLDARQPGTQVFVEGGEGRFLLLPPAQPGKAELVVTSGTVKSTAAMEFMPNLRPMIAAGIVEGTINLRSLSPSALQPAQSGDVFERQIQSASRSFGGGKGNVAARTALFLKGKVLGSSLLTLAYDSDKPGDTALFRDIQPNQFYPVYGDSSARGFDAQSTGKLYVMLQNGTNYALLGDYSTQSDNAARQLTQYSRALNGVKGRYQEGAVTVEGFASRTSTTQLVQEFRANGTSGPFMLNINGVVNSQQVDILTRSRSQASVIINNTPLTQFTDYEIEPFSGRLLLKAPVPSVDTDLNPIFVRVSYSVDSGGAKHTVAGADARLQVTPEITLGASAMRDTNPADRQSLDGLNATVKLGEKTVATGEIARSTTDLQGNGSGQRVEIRHEDQALQARVWGAKTSAGFYNPNSVQSAGQSEYGAKIGYAVDEKNRVVGEALRTANSVTGASQTGAELKLEHSMTGNVKVEVGVRYSSANTAAALSGPALPGTTVPIVPSATALAAGSSEEVGTTTARVKVTVPVPDVPQADVYGQAEYAIDGSGGREVGVGGNYAINSTTRAYLRHDFVNSLKSVYTLNASTAQYTTVAGLNTELTDSTQLFNEYRMGDSINGRSSEAAIGLRRLWRLDNGVGLTASVQRIKPLSGVVIDDSSAVTLGADYTAAATWKASGQVQWQTSTTSNSWLLTGALANKLDDSWTMLNRGLYSEQTNLGVGGGKRELITAQSGVAYRPVETDVWNALGRIEYKKDADSTLGPGLNRDESGLILSTHLNVQPNRNWITSARYAAKWGSDKSNGISSRSFTQLIGGRTTWNLTQNWDVSLQASRMWGDGAAETAVGVEVGYLAWKNMWVSVGYNFKGFKASDMTGEAYTQRGLYLRVRFKFDENVLGGTDAAATPATIRTAAPQS
ncbi:conserved repeat domain-containing protein [Polaromonas sp. YR568]|uniref:SdrD B-like domain-containing protein n=1 Tax=Polaromonas sp. YR568 TaxID=1855301 RepID=UPI0008E02B51|nr:SdrD B-like domain-containing protein [Polaromonas sp. YR568]SFU99697.1 conserved repeat domain-containing protein [Polaromonas sp. YR568]